MGSDFIAVHAITIYSSSTTVSSARVEERDCILGIDLRKSVRRTTREIVGSGSGCAITKI